MARDIKWAVKEAEQDGSIVKISVEDDTRKKLVSGMTATYVKMFFASLIFLAVAIAIVAAIVTFAHIIFYSVKMVIIYILLFILPFYSIYGIFNTLVQSKKGDFEFFEGEIITKTDKGYKIKGLEDQDLDFPKIAKPKEEPSKGSRVKIFRLGKEIELFDI